MSNPIQYTKLVRIQAEIDGETASVGAFFESGIVVDDQTYAQPWKSVSWGAGTGDKTVTVDGKTYTYAEATRVIAAIAWQEKMAADSPPPAPEPQTESKPEA